MEPINAYTLLLTIAGSFLVLIVSPGPNFLVIGQISVNQSRLHGICSGLGVASGSITWALLAATGLGIIFWHVPLLHPAVQLAGGLYLCYLAYRSLKGAGGQLKARSIDEARVGTLGRAWSFGYATNMSNPKALAFYTSVFSLVTAAELPDWVRVAGVGVIAVMAITWFVLLATLFSIPRVQVWYRSRKLAIDIVTGIVMLGFGLRLLWGVVSMVQAA
jgi:threonine/homoserine/homoserine lactone efflux protein